MNRVFGRSDQKIEADIVAYDQEDRPVLIVGTKARANGTYDGIFQFLDQFIASEFPFGMFADFSLIVIFGKDRPDPDAAICSIKTADVLSFYEPAFGQKRIFPDYFDTLVEAWLRDFAFHWKSERPPASEELESIGLAQRLTGGMTYKGVWRDGSPLHRD